MLYTNLFFDLDDTLYPADNGLWSQIRQRMNTYMLERMHLPAEEIPIIRHNFFEQYGTTLRGLQIHYQVDADDFLAYVHDLPIAEILQPDPDLRTLLLGLPQKKWVLTNADANHARRVINRLGLEGCFQGIIDIRALNFICKPDPQAYRMAMQIAGEEKPERCVYIDDSPRNLAPAAAMGMFTILVGQNGNFPVAKLTISRPHDLRKAMPELWQNNSRDASPKS